MWVLMGVTVETFFLIDMTWDSKIGSKESVSHNTKLLIRFWPLRSHYKCPLSGCFL